MIGDDLVNSYHLLLCCLDLVFGNALLCANRKDLINPTFRGGGPVWLSQSVFRLTARPIFKTFSYVLSFPECIPRKLYIELLLRFLFPKQLIIVYTFTAVIRNVTSGRLITT